VVRRWLVLASWLAFVAASIAVLHRLGDWFPLDLIFDRGGPLEPALAAAMRLTGLMAGYWLAGSTILYLIGRAARLPAAIRGVGWATLGPVRRLIDGMVAGALVASIGLPAAAVAMTGSGYIPVPAGDPVETENPVAGSVLPGTLFLPTQQIPVPQVDDPESAAPHATGSNGPSEVVVQLGDHMWALAEQRLALVRGRDVSDTEIAPYWLKVVGINLSRIRSGDPDLIFPGEILLLPAIDP
jgi:hypothetical protein